MAVKKRFKILFVCTGNICRSPMAQQMLADKLSRLNVHSDFEVASAGTYAMVGQPINKPAAVSLQAAGYSAMNHEARQLSGQMLEESDLVLAATEEHRADIVRTLVRANRYSFTIKEFASIIRGLDDLEAAIDFNPGESLEQRLEGIRAVRGLTKKPAKVDLDDPYGLGQAAFDKTLTELETDLELIAGWLAR